MDLDATYQKLFGKTKDAGVPGMQLNFYTIQTTNNIPECMTVYELQQEMQQDEYLRCLKDHTARPATGQRSNATGHENILVFCGEMAVIDMIVLKGRV